MNMDRNALEHIDRRIDELRADVRRVEDKLDSHLERISAAEAAIKWIRGYIGFGTSVVLAVVTGAISYLYTKLGN